MIFGSLLGDSYAERRGPSTRIRFSQCNRHVAYLMWFHQFFAERGYCNGDRPVLRKTIGKGNKVYFYYRLYTRSYASFNWIQEVFYWEGKKRIPLCIEDYLTPLALAVWISDDGARNKAGCYLCTYGFPLEDVERMVHILERKFSLRCTIQRTKDGPRIYVREESMDHLRSLVLPHMVPSMHYKLRV